MVCNMANKQARLSALTTSQPNIRGLIMCEEQKKVEITKKEYEEYQQLKKDVELLKWRIVRSNIELTDWVEKNFGKLERE